MFCSLQALRVGLDPVVTREGKVSRAFQGLQDVQDPWEGLVYPAPMAGKDLRACQEIQDPREGRRLLPALRDSSLPSK